MPTGNEAVFIRKLKSSVLEGFIFSDSLELLPDGVATDDVADADADAAGGCGCGATFSLFV